MTEPSALLLNASYEPLRVISWQRAFVLVFHGKVDILEEHSQIVHSVKRTFKIPAVIRLRRWVNLNRIAPVIRFSRANLYARDEHVCQYCHKAFPESELTLDHVVPVSKGGKKTWNNIVTACLKCNQTKGDRLPDQAEMILLKKPCTPRWLPGLVGSVRTRRTPEVWEPYLSHNWALMNR